MRYASAGAFRTALEQRLLTQAKQTGVPLMRLRKLVAFDRLIARLMAAAPERWVLKGAVALHFRVQHRLRQLGDSAVAVLPAGARPVACWSPHWCCSRPRGRA